MGGLISGYIDLADGKIQKSISATNALQACAWCEYLESHARRIYSMISNIEIKAASLLSQKIKAGKLKNGFTLRDVYRPAWSILKNKKIAHAACNELVEAGWLRKVETPKNKAVYMINPKIKQGESNE